MYFLAIGFLSTVAAICPAGQLDINYPNSPEVCKTESQAFQLLTCCSDSSSAACAAYLSCTAGGGVATTSVLTQTCTFAGISAASIDNPAAKENIKNAIASALNVAAHRVTITGIASARRRLSDTATVTYTLKNPTQGEITAITNNDPIGTAGSAANDLVKNTVAQTAGVSPASVTATTGAVSSGPVAPECSTTDSCAASPRYNAYERFWDDTAGGNCKDTALRDSITTLTPVDESTFCATDCDVTYFEYQKVVAASDNQVAGFSPAEGYAACINLAWMCPVVNQHSDQQANATIVLMGHVCTHYCTGACADDTWKTDAPAAPAAPAACQYDDVVGASVRTDSSTPSSTISSAAYTREEAATLCNNDATCVGFMHHCGDSSISTDGTSWIASGVCTCESAWTIFYSSMQTKANCEINSGCNTAHATHYTANFKGGTCTSACS